MGFKMCNIVIVLYAPPAACVDAHYILIHSISHSNARVLRTV